MSLVGNYGNPQKSLQPLPDKILELAVISLKNTQRVHKSKVVIRYYAASQKNFLCSSSMHKSCRAIYAIVRMCKIAHLYADPDFVEARRKIFVATERYDTIFSSFLCQNVIQIQGISQRKYTGHDHCTFCLFP